MFHVKHRAASTAPRLVRGALWTRERTPVKEQTYEEKLIEIMRPHVGHTAMVQGYHEKEITERSIEPGNATMTYGGYVVQCTTCDRSLSQQWG